MTALDLTEWDANADSAHTEIQVVRHSSSQSVQGPVNRLPVRVQCAFAELRNSEVLIQVDSSSAPLRATGTR